MVPAATVWFACLTAAGVYGFVHGVDEPKRTTVAEETAVEVTPETAPEAANVPPRTVSPLGLPLASAERAGARLQTVLHRPLALRHYVQGAVDSTSPSELFEQELGASIAERSLVIGGIDYSDPIGHAAVPLVRIAQHRHEQLSPSFRVHDFAWLDGAPYARISRRLVQGLETLRSRTGSLRIISGYRHRARNARPEVGGVADSQHIAGRAADVASSRKSPLELAALALESMGCSIGLGLGPTSLHIDVRGRLASWTYPDASLSEAAFDMWVLEQCGRPVPEALMQAAASDTAAVEDTTAAAAPSPFDLADGILERYGSLLQAQAQAGYERHGPGAVVLDLSTYAEGEAVEQHLSYVPADAKSEVERLRLQGLLAECDWDQHFVYVVVTPSGDPVTGRMRQAEQHQAEQTPVRS